MLKTQDQSKQSLINLFTEVPQFVWVLREGVELQTPFEQLRLGDTIAIHAGEWIPVDGTITEGIGYIDQHKLTGEAQLAEKTISDVVFAATLLMSGKIYVQVDKAGNETVAAKIGEIISKTTDYKLSLQTRGEQIADQSALPTLTMGAITLPILGPTSAVAILYASFGYNMRIIAPLSVLSCLNMTAEKGILVKDGRALEELRKVDTVVFDKTGTLTQEQPTIATIYTYSTYTSDEILRYAATAEHKQAHPIARAILQEAQVRHLALLPIDTAVYEMGYGLKVWVEDDKLIRVGSAKFMKLEKVIIPTDIDPIQASCHEQGTSLVYIAINEQIGGVIELRTTIRPNTEQVINELHRRGMTTVIISGDHQKPTQQLARELNIDCYFAEILPEKKAGIIRQLQQEGKTVCYIGDGINDAIALKTANVSISLRGAATIATDMAQIILMDQHLDHLPYLFDQALNLDHKMKNNLILTIIPGFICIGGVYFLHFGLLTVTLLYNASLVAGVVNAMWPMIEPTSRIP
ncbi:MAG: heavy metal translocating P-type ATPase [Thioploca sp.]|nr:heavy metal translocating P-type ATPase [Thioploca sp.]